MALIELRLDPTARDLRWFGVLVLAFFLVLAAVVYFFAGSLTGPIWLALAGAVICVFYYAVRPLQILFYRGWLRLFYPVGWLISHILFAFIYFGGFMIVGLALRIFRYDPMKRTFSREANTYWTTRSSGTESSRYFQQF